MKSKITFWKFDVNLPFRSKPRMLDGLRIVRIDNLNLYDCTVVYEEIWTITSETVTPFGGEETIESFENPTGELKTWRWNDGSYAIEAAVQSQTGLTRQQDLLGLFYKKLAASRPEYAGQLVLATTKEF